MNPFTVSQYHVEGNTLLPSSDLERAVAPYLGEAKTSEDVEGARRSLEQLYHDRGFQTVLVSIPAQDVVAGIVRLTVLEAAVGEVRITGAQHHSVRSIAAAVPQLKTGVVPDFNEVQKELAQLNRNDDLHVTPVLRASPSPGQVDVDLDVLDRLPLHGSVEANNRYSADTAQLRLIGEVSYDNLFDRNQSVSLEYQTAPEHPDEVRVWSLTYVIPTHEGPLWALYAVRSNSSVAAVGDLNVIGNGKIFGFRFIDPLPASGAEFNHSLTVGLDFKDLNQDVIAQAENTSAAAPVKYAPITGQYQANWLGPSDPALHAAAATTAGRSSSTLDLTLEILVHGMGSSAAQFAASRPGASPSFYIFRAGAQRQQILPGNFSVLAKIDGQLADGPLIVNEQYAAGGAESVRGYTESERLGDRGAHGTLELRTPQLLGVMSPRLSLSYLYAFADAARLHVEDASLGEPSSYHLSSEGLGLRFKFDDVLAELDGARADTRGYVTRAGSYSAQFRLNYAW